MSPSDSSELFAHRLLRARDWQDRPEFDHLCRWWQKSLGGVYALVGIGGAGKTAVVDRFLQVLPGGYPELVGWDSVLVLAQILPRGMGDKFTKKRCQPLAGGCAKRYLR